MLRESMPRLQKYFSRKISDKARDPLIGKLKHHEGANLATPEPRRQALARLPSTSKSSSTGLFPDAPPRTPATRNSPASGARADALDCACL